MYKLYREGYLSLFHFQAQMNQEKNQTKLCYLNYHMTMWDKNIHRVIYGYKSRNDFQYLNFGQKG